MIKSTEEIIIYESPDGGKTIYSRDSGSTDRTLVKQDSGVTRWHEWQRWHEWREILKMAEDNVTLHDAIQRVEVIYALIKKENN
jgi:hypothetical protein